MGMVGGHRPQYLSRIIKIQAATVKGKLLHEGKIQAVATRLNRWGDYISEICEFNYNGVRLSRSFEIAISPKS